MQVRDPKSIIIISCFTVAQVLIIYLSLQNDESDVTKIKPKNLAPEYTEIQNLDYFYLEDGRPRMSLVASRMRSFDDESLEFIAPQGKYNDDENNKVIDYEGEEGNYLKKKGVLGLKGKVILKSDGSRYFSDDAKYFLKKDLILGKGAVKFEGEDPRTQDELLVIADSMRSQVEAKKSFFQGRVKGHIQRKKKYEGRINFSSDTLDLDGNASLAQLEGEVKLKKENYDISSGKADIYLENFNKELKYFVLNDDVKVVEKLQTKQGMQERRAFAERLEGFGREQKMILTGAPRVEMGEDVIKGYRITIRENVDLVEVDDAMSDVQVKQKKLKD